MPWSRSPSIYPTTGDRSVVSARKLAAALWEMNVVESPTWAPVKVGHRIGRGRRRCRGRFFDQSHTPVVDECRESTRHERALRSVISDENVELDSGSSYVSYVEADSTSQTHPVTEPDHVTSSRLKDVSNALKTSRELLKIICRVCSQQDQPSSSMSLFSALHSELERASVHVKKIIREQQSDSSEVNDLMRQAWKRRKRQGIGAAIKPIAAELKAEKRFRCQLESLNKKLGAELADMKASLQKASQEITREKKANQILETVSNELFEHTGGDKVRMGEQMVSAEDPPCLEQEVEEYDFTKAIKIFEQNHGDGHDVNQEKDSTNAMLKHRKSTSGRVPSTSKSMRGWLDRGAYYMFRRFAQRENHGDEQHNKSIKSLRDHLLANCSKDSVTTNQLLGT